MTLQRREGGRGVCVARRSMGLLLDGSQAKNLARQKTGTVATLASIPVHINSYNGFTTWNFQTPVCSIWEAAALAFSVGEFHPLPPSTLHYTHSPTIPSQHWRETGGALQKARQAHQSKVSLWLDFIKTLQNQTFTRSSLASPSIANMTCKVSLAGQTLTWCCQPFTLARESVWWILCTVYAGGHSYSVVSCL